jgi:prephenate dehydrogenase
VIEDLEELQSSLNRPEAIEEFIKNGNRGRAMIPGKHGGVARNYTFLPVVIEDKPGQLAALFDECASAGVNVEDLSIEHSPEQYTGLITLALSQSDAEKLFDHLLQRGWSAHSPR